MKKKRTRKKKIKLIGNQTQFLESMTNWLNKLMDGYKKTSDVKEKMLIANQIDKSFKNFVSFFKKNPNFRPTSAREEDKTFSIRDALIRIAPIAREIEEDTRKMYEEMYRKKLEEIEKD